MKKPIIMAMALALSFSSFAQSGNEETISFSLMGAETARLDIKRALWEYKELHNPSIKFHEYKLAGVRLKAQNRGDSFSSPRAKITLFQNGNQCSTQEIGASLSVGPNDYAGVGLGACQNIGNLGEWKIEVVDPLSIDTVSGIATLLPVAMKDVEIVLRKKVEAQDNIVYGSKEKAGKNKSKGSCQFHGKTHFGGTVRNPTEILFKAERHVQVSKFRVKYQVCGKGINGSCGILRTNQIIPQADQRKILDPINVESMYDFSDIQVDRDEVLVLRAIEIDARSVNSTQLADTPTHEYACKQTPKAYLTAVVKSRPSGQGPKAFWGPLMNQNNSSF